MAARENTPSHVRQMTNLALDTIHMPSDSTAGTESKGQSTEHGNWFVENVIHPLANGAAVEPWNAVASVADALTDTNILPKVDLLDVPKVGFGASWIAQSVSGGVGSLLPYIVAGKLTGGALKSTGRFIEATPSLSFLEFDGSTARFLSSDRTALIAGAGIYGGMRDPGQGESRLGNAVGSVVGFSAFELGGKLSEGLPLSRSLGIRFGAGFAGGFGQVMASNVVSHNETGSFGDLMKSGLAGGAMNVLLPFAQRGIGRVADEGAIRGGRPISAQSFAARANWSDNSELKTLLDKNPLTRVKPVDTPTQMDQKANVVELNRADSAPKLTHELSHRVSMREAEPQFKEAAALLDPKSANYNPELAWEKYRGIRVSQELAARQAEANAAAGYDMAKPAQVSPSKIGSLEAQPGRTYNQVWKDEFAQFQKSGGTFRPVTDYSGTLEQEPYLDPETGLHTFVYSEDDPWESDYGPVRVFERSQDGSYMRYIKADAVKDPENEENILGTVEVHSNPVQTYWGTANSIETFPDGSTHYNIVSGDNGVPDNVRFEVYPKGQQTSIGTVETIVRHADGSVDYGKADGTSVHEFATPESRWYGDVRSEETRSDDSMIYHLDDGGTVEWYPQSLNTPFGDVETVQRSGSTVRYIKTDGSTAQIDRTPEGLTVTETALDESTKVTHPESVVESYPNGVPTEYGEVNFIEHRADSTILHKVGGGSSQIFTPDQLLDTPYGQVERIDTFPDNSQFYAKTDGGLVELHPNGLKTPYGIAVAREVTRDGATNLTMQSGSTIEQYPQGVMTNQGAVSAIERGPNFVKLYAPPTAEGTAQPWSSMEVNFENGKIYYRDARGQLVPDGFKDAKGFSLYEEYPLKEFPQGKPTAHGSVRSTEIDENGNYTYNFADGTRSTFDSYQ